VDSESLQKYQRFPQPSLTAELIKYASSKMPGITKEQIRENLAAILQVKEAEEKCACCFSKDMCNELLRSNGYTRIMSLHKNGYVKVEYAPCEWNGETVEEEIGISGIRLQRVK
jgi:hypothetical protein